MNTCEHPARYVAMNDPTKYVAPSRADKVNLAIWTSAERRLALKRRALEMGCTVQEFVEAAIDEKLAKSIKRGVCR